MKIYPATAIRILVLLGVLTACGYQTEPTPGFVPTLSAIPRVSPSAVFAVSPTAPIPSPTFTASPAPRSTIYLATGTFAYSSPNNAQIWRVTDTTADMIYELLPVNAADPNVPIAVKESIAGYLGVALDSDHLAEVLLQPFVDELALSPEKDRLAWTEGYYWMPNPQEPIEFSFVRLHLYDHEHLIDETLGWTSDASLRHLVWSPVGRYLAYITRYENSDGIQIGNVQLWDTQTQSVTTVGEGYVAAWSPQGDQLAVDNVTGADPHLTIIPIDAPDRATSVSIYWRGGLSGFSWGPTNNALIAARGVDSFSGNERPGLFTIGLEPSSIIGFPTQTTDILDNPRWSPDGQNLAAEAKIMPGDNPSKLLVLSPSGELVQQFDLMDGYRQQWQWSSDSQAILRYVIRTSSTKDDLQILYPATGRIEIVNLPREVATGIENGVLFMVMAVW